MNFFLHKDAEFKISPKIIGDNIAIDKGVYCTANIEIGSYIHISPYVTIIGGIQSHCILEGFNNIMAGARIICCSDRFDDSGLFGALIPSKFRGKIINKPVRLEKFSNIGTNSIVLPGSILREGALLCAGSLLMGEAEAWCVYKGNPAKKVKTIDGSKIKQKWEELMCEN